MHMWASEWWWHLNIRPPCVLGTQLHFWLLRYNRFSWTAAYLIEKISPERIKIEFFAKESWKKEITSIFHHYYNLPFGNTERLKRHRQTLGPDELRERQFWRKQFEKKRDSQQFRFLKSTLHVFRKPSKIIFERSSRRKLLHFLYIDATNEEWNIEEWDNKCRKKKGVK